MDPSSRFRLPSDDAADAATENARLRALMESEYELAKDRAQAFSVMRIEVEALDLIRRVYGDSPAKRILRSVARLVSEHDFTRRPIGYPDAGTLLIAWPGAGLDEAHQIADVLIGEAKALQPTAGGRKLPVALSIGLAHSVHEDDYEFGTLERVATEGATVASAGGGDRCIHTELYSLLQPSAEKLAKRRSRTPVEEPRYERDLGGFAGAPTTLEEEPVGGPFTDPTPAEATPLRTLVIPRPAPQAPEPDPQTAQARALSAATNDEEAQDLSKRLETLFRGPAALAFSPRQMQEAVLEAVLAWKREQEISRQSEFQGEREREVEQLKRRLAKISQSLADTEAELARFSHGDGLETGVSSAFQSVQGIANDDPNLKTKKELMAAILEANLDLRKRIG